MVLRPRTFDAASCRVKFVMGRGVLFDIRELIKRTVSVSRETLKITLILLLVTVISLLVSGTDEANVHSSSSFAALVLLCVRFEVGAGTVSPNKSTAAEAGAGCLIDCWYWNGDPCRGVEVRAAKGSGVRDGWTGGCENAGGVGEEILGDVGV